MDELLPRLSPQSSGFRLQKVEVYNWGTFDSTGGTCHSVRTGGDTTLLIGPNGSGKSTLVDALLTLLVRPGVRNFNVAAGAHKQERDERTYIKGAYGRFSRDDDNRADIQFLRPGGKHYSALLASFRNEQCSQSFTLAQVLYLDSDGRSEKVYCFSPDERSLATDLAGLKSTEKLRQQLEKRGFRATTTYTEYHGWLTKATKMRAKAMDMFNQTVAVKDIQSLNRFIRDHMLEAKRWGDRVDDLLRHFTQLSEAHQSLVQVRRQSDLLDPVEAKGAAYRQQAETLKRIERLLAASDSFFRQQTVILFTPDCEAQKSELLQVQQRKQQLTQEMEEFQEECRRLRNEIELAGGDRLRQIPLLIQNHKTHVQAKRAEAERYHGALRQAAITQLISDAVAFAAMGQRLVSLAEELRQQITIAENRHVALAVERSKLSDAVGQDERELTALAERQGNLPEALAQLRRRLCEDLRLPERDVPFVAELVAVKAEERGWQGSIEMVLRNFALSLLVPQQSYPLVSSYVNRTRLSDGQGRGQRLVYLRVGERARSSSTPTPGPASLLRKLDFRDGHPLLPWVKGELAERFDYRCCDTIEEFQLEQDLALTRERHVKARGVRHEKDDRERAADPRYFVLGWDNREKRRLLAEAIRRTRETMAQLDDDIDRRAADLETLRQRSQGVRQALQITDFAAIDFETHAREIAALNLEKESLEQQNDVVRVLKQRFANAEIKLKALRVNRDAAVGNETQIAQTIESGEKLIVNARRVLAAREADGTFAQHAKSFHELETCFNDGPLTPATLFEQERDFTQERLAELNRLKDIVAPLETDLCVAMNRFLREFPSERVDLQATPEYLDSFLELHEYIRREDLPRHEERFKQRLNEKVTHEIGLLNAALQSERTEIDSKISVLNESLRQLEYRPGTHMRLEPRPVQNREIAEFQSALKECLAGTFEGTFEADEARYLKIEAFIARLRDDVPWRDKVTDVRRWFDFAAREIEDLTGAERAYYEDSTGQSGGEKAKLAFTILVAAIAYQYDIEPGRVPSDRFHFVVVDEMFSKVDDQYAQYALELFRKFGLQLLIVAPLDAKARVTEPYVGCYLHVAKDPRTNLSEIYTMTSVEFQEVIEQEAVGAGLRKNT